MLRSSGPARRLASELRQRWRSSRSNAAAPPVAAAVEGNEAPGIPEGLLPSGSICAELAKSKLSALVTASAAGGFLMAGPALGWPMSTPEQWTALAAIGAGTFCCSAAANALNQRHEIPRDSRMVRTRGRPLVQGRATADQARNFAIAAGGLGTASLLAGCGPIPAVLGFANIALYAGIYTRMKPLSEWNTNAGAIVGGIPPLMGWAAAGGSLAEPEAALLFASLYLWQFPHFYSLAYNHRKDYARGGFQMMPCNDPSGSRTARWTMWHAGCLTALPFVAAASNVTSSMFLFEGCVLNAGGLFFAYRFLKRPSQPTAQKVFFYSLVYLPLLLAGLVFHSKRWEQEKRDSTADSGTIAHGIEQWREAGRQICLHERGGRELPDAATERGGGVGGGRGEGFQRGSGGGARGRDE